MTRTTLMRDAMTALILALVAVLVLAAWVSDLGAYEAYRDPNQAGGMGYCAQCHEIPAGTGFVNRSLLHSAHTRNGTGTCRLCHTSTGDIPRTNSSGEVGGLGCVGCHGQPQATNFLGAGLRRHHALAGAPADNNGQVCADCHTNDPAPFPESTLPPYYVRADVIQKDPCNADGTEDFWSRVTFSPDGIGLDNDGDLLYDANDPDCAPPTCVDTDGDGYGDPGDPTCPNGETPDCDDAHADAFPGAPERFDTRDNDCDGLIDEIEGVDFGDASNPVRLTWTDQPPAGQLYDVIRSDAPDFLPGSASSVCLELATPMTFADDAGVPAAGTAFFYLVRNTLVTDYGVMSDGTPRLHALCP